MPTCYTYEGFTFDCEQEYNEFWQSSEREWNEWMYGVVPFFTVIFSILFGYLMWALNTNEMRRWCARIYLVLVLLTANIIIGFMLSVHGLQRMALIIWVCGVLLRWCWGAHDWLFRKMHYVLATPSLFLRWVLLLQPPVNNLLHLVHILNYVFMVVVVLVVSWDKVKQRPTLGYINRRVLSAYNIFLGWKVLIFLAILVEFVWFERVNPILTVTILLRKVMRIKKPPRPPPPPPGHSCCTGAAPATSLTSEESASDLPPPPPIEEGDHLKEE